MTIKVIDVNEKHTKKIESNLIGLFNFEKAIKSFGDIKNIKLAEILKLNYDIIHEKVKKFKEEVKPKDPRYLEFLDKVELLNLVNQCQYCGGISKNEISKELIEEYSKEMNDQKLNMIMYNQKLINEKIDIELYTIKLDDVINNFKGNFNELKQLSFMIEE
jgi:hypothetical protein